MYRLKDVDIFCSLAEKLQQGRPTTLQHNEQLSLTSMLRKKHINNWSLQGLFRRHKSDGHVSRITEAKGIPYGQPLTLQYRFRLFCICCKDVYFMSTTCGRPQGGGVWLKNTIFCGRHKWMAPK